MKGIRYTKKRVAPPNSKPVPVATREGVSNMGTVFLKPYLSVEYVISKLIALPTNSWGFDINKGIKKERV